MGWVVPGDDREAAIEDEAVRVVARRAPKIAFLSTTSPIRSRLRTNRSAEGRSRRVVSLTAHHRAGSQPDLRSNVIGGTSTRGDALVEADAVEGGTGQGETGKFP